jgi:Zn-dependent protease
MTQFSVEPPAMASCSFCGRPIPANHWRVNGRPACEPCAGRLGQLLELNQFRFGPWLLGLVYGLAAAILCGFGWAVIVKVIHAEIGIIAIGIGIVVTRAIIAGANGRRGGSIQAIAIICSLLGIFVGKGLIAAWVLWDQAPKDVALQGHPMLMRALVFVLAPILGFQLFDLIWYGFAAYQAWRMTRPIQLRLDPPQPVGYPAAMSGELRPEMFQPAPPRPVFVQPAEPPKPRNTPLPKALAITLVSAVISAFIYANEEGWPFAAGSVLCILVHEMGHTIACLLYGLPASSPIFIPYVGAVISLRANPPNAKVESVIGIAGPWGGLLATAVCFVWFKLTHSRLAADLVQFGGLVNLFNLLPIHPLDGGRIARGVAPAFWAGFAAIFGAFCWLSPSLGIRREVAILLAVIAAIGIFRTLKLRRGVYYQISETAAWLMGFAYLGTAGALLWMWVQVRGIGSLF